LLQQARAGGAEEGCKWLFRTRHISRLRTRRKTVYLKSPKVDRRMLYGSAGPAPRLPLLGATVDTSWWGDRETVLPTFSAVSADGFGTSYGTKEGRSGSLFLSIAPDRPARAPVPIHLLAGLLNHSLTSPGVTE
jgi:hypothetical protein